MRSIIVALMLGIALGFAMTSHAVPPAYEGQLGNPEEPALRVIKWPWLGLRKLALYTHEGLKCGIECHPPAAVCEGAHGAARGSFVLVDHIGHGIIYSKLPPKGPLKQKITYEEKALAYIDDVMYAQKEAEHLMTTQVPSVDPSTVDEYGNPYLTVKQNKLEKINIQRRYVPLRTAQRDRAMARKQNLLHLAR